MACIAAYIAWNPSEQLEPDGWLRKSLGRGELIRRKFAHPALEYPDEHEPSWMLRLRPEKIIQLTERDR